jgi:thiopurine S-methyltransferase
MVWLAEQGHKVAGAELSPVAVDKFFSEQGLSPSSETVGGFTVKKAEAFEIWCGDFFKLPREAVADVAAVYDRAALVSFPPSDQPRYGEKLIALTPRAALIAIVALAFPETEMQGPPFPAPLAKVAGIFGTTHTIAIMETRDGLEKSPNLKERGLTKLEESLFLLRPK